VTTSDVATSFRLKRGDLARLLDDYSDLFSARLGISLTGLDSGELFG
jgi:hypothetical protein